MERLPTGIPELDQVLGGGLPTGSLVVLGGAPGTGKTILAQQIAFANATDDKPALYYTTLSESQSKIVRHLEPFSFFDRSALDRRVRFLHVTELVQGATDGDRGLTGLFDAILDAAYDEEPALVVVDSAKALRHFADPSRLREIVFDLASKISHTGAVLLFVGEYTDADLDGPEFAVADGIIELSHDVGGPVDRRHLRVRKMRGSATLMGKHGFRITEDGHRVIPRLESVAPLAPVVGGERLPFGEERLDEMTQGGLPPGEATLLMGPSGSGKTVLSSEWITNGLRNGDKGLFISFEESRAQLRNKADGFGWDWSAHLASGALELLHIPPVELDIDELADVVRRRMDAGGYRRVVVDSLGEVVPIAQELGRFPGYMWALSTTVTSHGAGLVFTQETSALGPHEARFAQLSYLFHNVLVLRYVELDNQVDRALMVLKMRESEHDKRLVQFRIGDHGFEVAGEVLQAANVLGPSSVQVRKVRPLAR